MRDVDRRDAAPRQIQLDELCVFRNVDRRKRAALENDLFESGVRAEIDTDRLAVCAANERFEICKILYTCKALVFYVA